MYRRGKDSERKRKVESEWKRNEPRKPGRLSMYSASKNNPRALLPPNGQILIFQKMEVGSLIYRLLYYPFSNEYAIYI